MVVFHNFSLSDDDKGAAKTGETQTTMEVKSYLHPTNPKITLYDLPGIGTPEFPVSTYCEKVNLNNYDIFLIFSMKRFTENDLILAKKIKDLEKTFFFVRTHIDVDYNNAQRRKTFNEESMLANIRKECWDHLKDVSYMMTEAKVFLISNHDPNRWDFPSLTTSILKALPFDQRQCLTLSLSVLTRDLLKEKANVLRGMSSEFLFLLRIKSV